MQRIARVAVLIALPIMMLVGIAGGAFAGQKPSTSTKGSLNSPTWTKPQKLPNGGYRSEKGTDTLFGKNANRKGIDRNNHLHFHKDGVTVTHNGRKTTAPKLGK